MSFPSKVIDIIIRNVLKLSFDSCSYIGVSEFYVVTLATKRLRRETAPAYSGFLLLTRFGCHINGATRNECVTFRRLDWHSTWIPVDGGLVSLRDCFILPSHENHIEIRYARSECLNWWCLLDFGNNRITVFNLNPAADDAVRIPLSNLLYLI